MEDETKIFIAWLKKLVKIDKKITGKKLAGLIGRDPTTISSYLRDRTKPNFKIRSLILEKTGTPFQEMMDIGRKSLNPPPLPQDLKDQIREVLKEETQIIDITTVKNVEHLKIIQQFKNPELASLINGDLLQLEKLNPKSLKKIHNYIKFEIGQTEEDRN